MNIEDNWNELIGQLNEIKRDGIDALIHYLEDKTDFKIAPASTKFHLSVEGGLVQHSLNVLKYGKLINKEMNNICDNESVILTCLMHDLCKTNYYIKGWEWDKEHKEKYNEWRKKEMYKVEDKLPLGHGERSVIQLVRYVELTPDEMSAIRWHMSGFDASIHFNYPTGIPFRESMNRYPLLKLLIIADQMAEMYESINEAKE